MQWITALDFQILHEIQNRFSCSFLDFWMPKITALGNGGILWILLAVLLLCISKTRKNGIQLGVGNMGCGLIGNLLLKNLVARDRPCWLEEHAMLIAVPPGLLVSVRTYHGILCRSHSTLALEPESRSCRLSSGRHDRIFPAVSLCAFSVRCAGRRTARLSGGNCGSQTCRSGRKENRA